MKLNFKKLTAIGASLVMTGATMGIAAAASYPAPFISGGTANVAVVYGTGSDVSSLDLVEATNIQSDLDDRLGSTGGSVVEGGDSFKFNKTSTKFHLGDVLTTITSSIDDSEFETLLADGEYMDDDNDEFEFTQKITFSSSPQLTMFDDDDYERDSPTVGFKITDATEILNYTLDFSKTPYWTDLDTTELPIMGKNYYVLSHGTNNNSLTLLDSAASEIIEQEETKTITVDGKTYTVTASIFDTANSKVKLSINGETTNLLGASGTQKLSDGSYVGIKEVVVQNYQGGTNQVEFSIGKGKLLLTDSDEVQINDKDIDNLYSYITNSSTTMLGKITLQWKADDDIFVAEGTSATMPGFETVSLSFGGLNYPAEEEIMLGADGNDNLVLQDFPLEGTTETINLLYTDGTSYTLAGKDSNNLLATPVNSSGTDVVFTESTHDYFVVSYKSGDDAESYLVRATNFDDSNYPTNEVDFEYASSGTWELLEANAQAGDDIEVGSSASFTVGTISNESAKTVWVNSTGSNSFNKMYSAEGLEVYLPWVNSTFVDYGNDTVFSTVALACGNMVLGTGELFTGTLQYNASSTSTAFTNTTACATTWKAVFTEEDKDDAIASGDWINVTAGIDSDGEVTISSYATSNTDATASEIGESKEYRDFTYSELATEILDDQSGDHESIKLIYHGAEVAADVYITSADAVVTSGDGSLGEILVKDTEVSSVSTKNLIVVGGSCINSAAATLVGGAYCGSQWTDMTNVGSGQFLIKGYSSSDLTSKMALLVAGYDAADTVNAAKYLRNKAVDTSKEYMGTSATSATLVTTEA